MIPESLQMLLDGEAANQTISLKVLSRTGAVAVLGPINEAYKTIGDIAAASGLIGDDRVLLTLILLQRCRYTLDKGVLEALRLHWGDSYQELRQGIEAAGSADLLLRNPRHVKIWLDAGGNDAAYGRFRDTFTTRERLPKTDPLTKELKHWYGLSSKMAHDSIFGFAQRLIVSRDPQKVTVGYGYFDGANKQDPIDTAGQVIAHIKNHVQVHLLILKVLARAMDPALRHDRAKWDAAYKAASDALDALMARLHQGISLPVGPSEQAVIQLKK